MSISAWAAVSYLRLRNVSQLLGRDELAKLVKPDPKAQPATYSLEPFIRTNSIFVHVPKTAGISVCRALYGNLGMGHLSVRDYRALFRRHALKRMFKFAFVRNPFDRIHSAYHYLRAGGADEEDAEFAGRVLSKYPTFEKFVLDGLDQHEVSAFWHFRPQTDFILTDEGRLDCLDFIGCYETFEEDFGYVRRRLKSNATPPHVNRTPGKGDYRRDYTYEMADVVSRRYAAAIDLFGYDFDRAKRPVKPGTITGLEVATHFSDAFQLRRTEAPPRG